MKPYPILLLLLLLSHPYSWAQTSSPGAADNQASGVPIDTAYTVRNNKAIALSKKLDLTDDVLSKDYIQHLSQSIPIATISDEKEPEKDSSALLRFHAYLQKTFPLAHAVLQKEVVNKYSLLYIWKGQNPKLAPVMFLAHMDVVPVDTGASIKWTEPAFSGKRKDGYIWGRGTMDDKVAVIGLMEAVESLIRGGYQPMRDIYFGFGHDEESAGSGAAAISALLLDRGLHFRFILDEGGGVIDGSIPYVNRPVAFIGIAEKGYLTLQLTANDAGGHSSLPVNEGVVGILGKAIYRLQESPFPTKLTAPVKQMFRELGKNMPGINGFIAMHPGFFSGLIRNEMGAHPITSSLIQTTQAPTMIEGGVKDNVMPATARMVINFRILPGETIQSTMARVKRVVHDKRITIDIINDAWNPSKVASTRSKGYKVLKYSIEKTFANTGVVPSLNPGLSDSRQYAKLSNNILRFVPLCLKEGDADRIHGTNERILETNYKDCIRFYYHFLMNADLQL